jgi:hypothetical protein
VATFSVESVDEDGLAATYNSAAAGGDQFANNGEIVLHIKNTNASARTVTVTAQNTSVSKPGMGSLTKANASVSVPGTTGERFLGPFPTDAFNDSSGNCQITYTAETGVTVAVLKVTKS